MYLIQIQLNDRQSQSEYLKQKIIELSKDYIDAVAKEKGLRATELGDTDNGEYECWQRCVTETRNLTSSSLLVALSAHYVKSPLYFGLKNIPLLLFCFNLYLSRFSVFFP